MIEILTDKDKLDVSYIHTFLSTSYWAKNIPRAVVKKSIENSFCFGVYKKQAGKQIGFARVVTDFATFAYIADVFIDQQERGKGYANRLMQTIMGHEELQGLRRWYLATSDAHGLYEKFNFSSLSDCENHMEKRIALSDLYRK